MAASRGAGDGPGFAVAPRSPYSRPSVLALVGAGGFLGTLCRWGLRRLVGERGGWPLATLVVNLVGAFVLGLLLEALSHHRDEGLRRALRLGLGTGFCGALTTYSTFAVEVVMLADGGNRLLALLYPCVTVAGGLLLALAGVLLAGRGSRAQRGAATAPGAVGDAAIGGRAAGQGPAGRGRAARAADPGRTARGAGGGSAERPARGGRAARGERGGR